MKIVSRTHLSDRETIIILWWRLIVSPKYDWYKEGINLGMAERFAFKRAVKYGRIDKI